MPNEIRDISSIDEESFPYIFQKDVSIKLTTSTGLVRCNIYRPKTTERVPVLVTYGPYGKDISYEEYVVISNHPPPRF
jgi:predicted acyl esterase